MADLNRDILTQYMDAYKLFLDSQKRGENARPLSNVQEDYKRGIAEKASELLNAQSWDVSQIGGGTIGNSAIKAVQRNLNLIGRFQVSDFSEKVRENFAESEQTLFDLYHEHKEQECFDRLCVLFGRKYDLLAYLYFILNPNRYLPLRSSIFDSIFRKLGIDLQTSGRCSWDNYQEFLSIIAIVRDEMRVHYQIDDVDLLDAHSFLWTINLDVLKGRTEKPETDETPMREKKVEIGITLYHTDYGEGTVIKITENKIYVSFGTRQRIFPFPEAIEKEYLTYI